MMTLTNEQANILKGKGYILNEDGEHFSCRVVVPAGKLKAQEAQKISEVCEKFGQGYFRFTQRQNVEIPGIEYSNLEKATQALAEIGLTVGSTGPRPRPISTCNGSECKFSLYDTDALTAKLNERFYKGFYDASLPSSF